ncbi:MAG: ATP-binding cassette domain-containing protein [Frankiaceae bacterium]
MTTTPGEPLFVIDDVTVAHPSVAGDRHSLHGVTQPLAAARVTALVGPSGAGKTTLLRLLNRLEEPSSGQVRFHGRPLPAYDVLALRRRVGMLQQSPVLLGATVLDDLRVGAPGLTEAEAAVLLDRVGLPPDELADRRTEGLSGGEAQRLCLARALAIGPEVLLLDEPTSALDSFAAAAVERVVRGLVDAGLTVVMVSHDLRQARRLADDVVVLIGGQVAHAGTVRDVFGEDAPDDVRTFLRGAS